MTTATPPSDQLGSLTVREVRADDAGECARICFEAFAGLDDHHRFQRDFPTPGAAEALMSMWVPHPAIWGVVAELDGRIVGSNFIDQRNPVAGVGPVSVEPRAQGGGVGRALMRAVIERGRSAAGVRLQQDTFNVASLGLYRKLGFEVKEPVGLLTGTPTGDPSPRVEVRPMAAEDLDQCAQLCRRAYGFERTAELRDAIEAFAARVAVRDGRICAYGSSLTFWPLNHGVAEGDEAMRELLLGAAAGLEEPLALLVPLCSPLFAWCLEQGLRLVKPMTLMAYGEYREPEGAWYPSVLY